MSLADHVWQWVSKFGRPGSANGLKARSHPGGERLEEIALLAELEECSGRFTIPSRSLLLERSTEAAIAAALSATTGAVSTQKLPAMKKLKSAAATVFLRLKPDKVHIDVFPALLEAFVIGKARMRAGTITIVLC